MAMPDTGVRRTADLRPVLKWAGGKSGLIGQLACFFPATCKRYIEPFFGGGAVYFGIGAKLAGTAILADCNDELITFYGVVRDAPSELMLALDAMAAQYSERYYYQVRAQDPSDPLDRAARTLFLNKTGFNGLYRQNSSGGFNVPFGKRLKCPALYVRENLLGVSRMLACATLNTSDFAAILAEAASGDVVYCDPPYEPVSRTSSFNSYVGAGFGRDDQLRLRDACLRASARGAHVVVSNSSVAFIYDAYQGCEIHVVQARRAINSKATGRAPVDELVIVLRPRC